MHPSIRIIALLSVAGATALSAQGPGGPPMGQRTGPAGGAGAPAAKLLLANSGELDLTDAQVVRLAAIARRSETRRRSLRAAMDSARVRFGQPGDSVGRRQFRDRMSADLDRVQEQTRVDQRDAIAVLTADQQAKAWDMVANRGRAMRGGTRSPMGNQMRGGRRGEMRTERPRMRRPMRDEFGPGMPGPQRVPRPPRDQ